MERISRRAFNVTAAALIAAPSLAWPASATVPKSLDHVILGCNDLDAGVEFVYQHTGIRAAAGGVHPGAGTKNALLSLGELRYLEIIAPDPLQSSSTDPRHVSDLKSPALVGWAIHRNDVEGFASVLTNSGVESVGPKPGSRARPDGSTLTWKSLTLKDDNNGVLPFFHKYRAAIFPGDRLGAEISTRFRAATGEPLRYVIATMWLGGNVSRYSPERPARC